MKNRYLMVLGLIATMLLNVNSAMAEETGQDTVEKNSNSAIAGQKAMDKHREDRAARREAMKERIKNMTPEEKQAFFKQRMEERLAKMTPEQREAFEKHRAERIARFDTDGDGELNDTEREKARQEFHAKMLERFDTDGDGQLSEDERRAAREAHREYKKK